MCSVVVKAPNDLLTRRPFLSGRMTSSYGHGVNGFLDKFIGHRTTDIRHLTSCGFRSFVSQLLLPSAILRFGDCRAVIDRRHNSGSFGSRTKWEQHLCLSRRSLAPKAFPHTRSRPNDGA